MKLYHPLRYSISLADTAAGTAWSSWMEQLRLRKPELSYDVIDVDRANQIQRILPTRQGSLDVRDISIGTPLHKAHHLVFFRPTFKLRDLGPDGSCTELNAPPPFSRRMWAGGSMTWSRVPLPVGSEVTQALTIPHAEHKKDMIFVHQQRVLYPGRRPDVVDGDQDWSLKETRIHVFRPSSTTSSTEKKRDDTVSSQQSSTPTEGTSYSFDYIPTSPLLFLYSALTHNPHKIHYDKVWSVTREGQKGPLVHGPLSATLLVELANSVGGKELREFKYRARSPMVLDERISMTGSWKADGSLSLKAEQSNEVGMTAVATYHVD